MNGYLVVLCHSMDDLPVYLTTDEDEAMRVAESLDEMPTSNIRQVFNLDCRTPQCVKVVMFLNGVPAGVRVVKEFF